MTASCTQPVPVIEPNDPSAPTTIAITKPPQEPILRIETEMHTARISHISVEGTGRYLVTASDDKTLRVWEASTGRLLRVLRPPIGQGNEGKMYAVAISPDGNTIAGAGWSGLEWDRSHSIYLFDKSSGRMLKRITGLPQSIPHLAFSPDGRVLLVTFHGKSGIRFYRTADSALLAEDRDYRGETYGASFDASGRVVTASYDGFLRLYGRDFTLLAQAQVSGEKRPFAVSITADGSKIAAGYENSAQVDVFSGETLQYLYSPDTSDIKKGYLNVVSWSFDGDTLYAGGQYRIDDKHPIRKWAKQGQGQWIDLPASSNTILRIVPLSAGGIAYGSSDPAFGVFDARDARILYKGSDVLDYRDSHEKFLLSHDGATVQFAYNKGRQFTARFSVVDRLLEQNPVSPATLHPPRTTAPGLAIENWKNSQAPTLNGRPLRLLQYEVSRSVAIAPDDQAMLMGTVWHLRLFDRQGRELWRVPVPANIWSVTIAGNGLVATAALADGTIRWYRMADGQELLALFPHPDTKRWVAWTPSGYYDAAPGAEALLGWHKNYSGDTAADFFPAAQFRSVSYKPVVVKEVLETLDEQQAVLRSSINTTLKPSLEPKTEESQTTKLLPLSVAIISPSNGAALSSTTVKIRYRVGTESSGSPNDIIAMVDGRTISTSRGIAVVDASAAAGVRELEVQIPERDCEVSLAVTNRSGGRGKPASVRLKWKPAFAVKPMLYAVAIGVSNGENEKPSATLAGKDAQDFAAALQLQTGNLYRGVTAKVLADDQASKDSILDALDWLDRETTGKDVAMIFMKGQAVSDKNGIPYFLAAGSKTNQLRRTALPFSDIRNVIGALAGRSVIFMDACQAGDLRSTEACAGAITNLVSDLSSSEQGAVVFSSSTAKHYAQESTVWGNGAFTMALIEGLKGKASYNESKNITVSMLDLYLSERIKSVTKGQQISASAKTYDLPDFVLAAPQAGSQEIARPSAAPSDSSKQVPSQQSEILRRLPPVLTILSPQDGTAASATNLTIRYEVRIPTGEPVTEIIGLLDGRPFPIPISRPALRGGQESPNLEIRELQVEVPERESEISILAKNRWASSEPSTIRVRWEKHGRPAASLPKPTLHALVIGVGRYDDSSLTLQFSAKDALDFAAALKRQQGGLYKAVVTKVLTDAEATKENILEGLDWLDRETTRNDVAVVFLAGHGVNDKNGVYYFLPVNAKSDRLRRTGLAFSDIKNTVASLAGKTLLFADTCHAGNILGRRRGTVDINAVVNELTSAENGAVVFASSTGKQDSLEDPIWGNGAFTKALVEALNGKAAYGGNKKITINMLDLYLSERVKELTRGQQTPTTTKPQTIQDFPIAIQLGPA